MGWSVVSSICSVLSVISLLCVDDALQFYSIVESGDVCTLGSLDTCSWEDNSRSYMSFDGVICVGCARIVYYLSRISYIYVLYFFYTSIILFWSVLYLLLSILYDVANFARDSVC